MKPTKKVTAAALAGAISVLLTALLNHYADLDLGPSESQAITVLLSFAAAWVKAET